MMEAFAWCVGLCAFCVVMLAIAAWKEAKTFGGQLPPPHRENRIVSINELLSGCRYHRE